MLRTIARFAIRRPLIVIVAWIAIVGVGFGVGIGVFGKLVPDVGTVPGSESSQAEERINEVAPRPEALTAVITGESATDAALNQAVTAAIEDARAVPGVAEVSPALPSEETGQALLVEVTLEPGDHQATAAEAVADVFHDIDTDSVAVAGGPLSDEEFTAQAEKDVAKAEMLSMPVVLVLLLIVFGGILAAGLPLLIAAVGVGGTFGILYAFSTFFDISIYAIQITTMLAVGLAVDYALLMVNRFREERRATSDVATAVTRTTATAGRTVLFSGLTVAVALLGLVVFPDPFLRSMGLAGAAVVLVDMAAAVTLLPALLARFGHRISPAKERSGGFFTKVARGVQRRPVVTLVATAGAMLTLATPVLDLHISDGDARMLPTSTATRQMWDGLTTHFPDQATASGDIRVIADVPPDPSATIEQLTADMAAVPGIVGVDVETPTPGLAVFNAELAGPADAAAARDAVAAIRDLPTSFGTAVAGNTARLVDYQSMLTDRLPWAIALIAIGTLILLFLFTGSIVLPIKAVLTSLLSIGAALGVVVWVFQQGNLASAIGTDGLGYVHLTVPVLVGAIAFGLSVDYEVFLLSRIRERWLAGAGARGSIVDGLERTGRIVTAAALLIGVVFAGFVTGGFAPIKAVGLGLVLAVALDATLVRMLLVPATMTLLGNRNWWLPAPLERLHRRLGLSEADSEQGSDPSSREPEAQPQRELELVR